MILRSSNSYYSDVTSNGMPRDDNMWLFKLKPNGKFNNLKMVLHFPFQTPLLRSGLCIAWHYTYLLSSYPPVPKKAMVDRHETTCPPLAYYSIFCVISLTRSHNQENCHAGSNIIKTDNWQYLYPIKELNFIGANS